MMIYSLFFFIRLKLSLQSIILTILRWLCVGPFYPPFLMYCPSLNLLYVGKVSLLDSKLHYLTHITSLVISPPQPLVFFFDFLDVLLSLWKLASLSLYLQLLMLLVSLSNDDSISEIEMPLKSDIGKCIGS